MTNSTTTDTILTEIYLLVESIHSQFNEIRNEFEEVKGQVTDLRNELRSFQAKFQKRGWFQKLFGR